MKEDDKFLLEKCEKDLEEMRESYKCLIECITRYGSQAEKERLEINCMERVIEGLKRKESVMPNGSGSIYRCC